MEENQKIVDIAQKRTTKSWTLSTGFVDIARKRTTNSWTLPTRSCWLCSSISTFYGHRIASK